MNQNIQPKDYGEYDGTCCESCGRERNLIYRNGDKVCEKCNWDQVRHQYWQEPREIGQDE